MKQTWNDLLFAHWPIPIAQLRPLVPDGLVIETFDGQCWIGVVPFWMSGIRARGLPPMPGFSRLPELNLRTYVTYGDKPGVYFFSLDITSHLAVWGARTFYHLPYFHAAMDCREQGGRILIPPSVTTLRGRTHDRLARGVDDGVRPYTSRLNSLAAMGRLDLLASATKDRSRIFLLRATVSTRSTKTRYTDATFIICLGLCRTRKLASNAIQWQRRRRLTRPIRLLFFISRRSWRY